VICSVVSWQLGRVGDRGFEKGVTDEMAVVVWRGDYGVIPVVIAKSMMKRSVGLQVSFAYSYAC
jgi:hypothetical protein